MRGYGTAASRAKRPSGNDGLRMSAGGAPPPPLSTKDGLRALSRNPGKRLTPGATGDPVNDRTQKTGPMCISRRLLGPSAHGADLIVAAFSARASCDASSSPAMVVAIPRRLWLAEKPRAYFFIFLVFLATFLVALAVFFAFFAMSSSWGWLA